MANEKLVTRETAKEVVSSYTQKLETGQIVPSKSLTAKELETVSPESGDTQETPFALQGTGTANGTSSVDTGTVGKHIQKQGSVYCVNQLFDASLVANTTVNDVALTNNGNGYFTINGTNSSSSTTYLMSKTVYVVGGHKVLIRGFGDGVTYRCYVVERASDNSVLAQGNVLTDTIRTLNANTVKIDYDILIYGSQQVSNKKVLTGFYDLTQWFNGNIPQDLLDHLEHWSWYQTYGDYIAYNTGTLVSGNGQWLVCGGRNIWDEQWELGYIDNSTGENVSGDVTIRSKNYTRVLPNTIYYIKVSNGTNLYAYDINKNFIGMFGAFVNQTFTTPQNCCYIRFRVGTGYGTTYNNDITISLYYAGEDYSQYYPYEQPKVYDTGSEKLLSTGVKLSASGEREDIYDYKEPSGSIVRRVAIVDLGTLTYSRQQAYGVYEFYTTGISSLVKTGTTNIVSSMYLVGTRDALKNMDMAFASNGTTLFIRNDSYSDTATFKSAMSGVYLFYELATPTTEQGTPFSENIEINDFGTMGWYSAYTDSNTNTLVSVPQGCKIFYPAWYVGFIDTLGQRADIDWDASEIVSQTELGVVDTKHDNLYAIMQENVGGTLRHQLSASASIDFENTAWVDLGSLNWYLAGSYNAYSTGINDLVKRPANYLAIPNVLCSIYKTVAEDDISSSNMSIGITAGGGVILIKDTNMNNLTKEQVKEYLKGILLAYEKAS